MTTAVADLSALLEGIPAGAWVAISEAEHRVVAYGPDAQQVMHDAKDKGVTQPLLLRVPDRQASMFF